VLRALAATSVAMLVAIAVSQCDSQSGSSGVVETSPGKTPGQYGPGIPPGAPDCTSTASEPTGRDDTGMLQAWLASLPNGEVACLREGATYTSEGTLTIDHRSNFVLAGNGAVLVASSLVGDLDPGPKSTWRFHLRIVGGSDVTVQNLGIRGAGSCTYQQEFEGEAGVLVQGTHGLLLENLSVSGVGGDGVEITREDLSGKDTSGIEEGVKDFSRKERSRIPKDVTVDGGSYRCLGRIGVAITGSADTVNVRDARFDRMGRSTFIIELTRDSDVAQRITFEGNTVGSYGNLFVGIGGRGVQREVTVRDTLVESGTLWSKVGSPDGVANAFEIRFEDNVSHVPFDRSGPVVSLNGVDGLAFVGNTQAFRSDLGAIGLAAEDSSDVVAAENDFTGAVALCSGCLDGGGNKL
jgi:hypothetical protein